MTMPSYPILLGAVGRFGVPSDETGVIIDSISADHKVTEKKSMTRQSQTQGLAYIDPIIDLSLKFYYLAGSASGLAIQKVAALMTLAITLRDHGISGGSTICKGVKDDYKTDDWETGTITGTLFPYVTGS